jgi:hypothetical protein
MTMTAFQSNEDNALSIDMNDQVEDLMDDDDLDETIDKPLPRPKVDFVPTRDPLVAALFGPAVVSCS